MPATSWPLVALLQDAIRQTGGVRRWDVALDWQLPRLGCRIDAVLASASVILAILWRPGTVVRAADRRAAEDAALDLADFHDGSRGLPVIPVVLVPNGAMVRTQLPLPLPGAAAALDASRLTLPALLRLTARFPAGGGAAGVWATADYAPSPGLIEAARSLYADHDVAALLMAGAGSDGVQRTRRAVAAAIADRPQDGGNTIVFVTGAPGAGKTLCGLDLAFGSGRAAAYLTGNPTLVHVLREALARDAAGRGLDRRAALRRLQSVIQALPAFRDHYVGLGGAPAERLIVIDEAQRCWSRAYAVGKTRNTAVRLTDSEPGHLLDIAARVEGPATVVCLIGGGQEIHDGEGGLAAWGEALLRRPDWRVFAPETMAHPDPRQRMPALPGLRIDPALHLSRPVRPVRAPHAARWVDAVLSDAPALAASIAQGDGGVPFVVTRSLALARGALRPLGSRCAGLVASSTARRLRAEGLGSVLPHQDESAVASWFLDRWPDIRSGDALETVATEFAVQGLELDLAGLCWDLDLVRGPEGWRARRFRATAWTRASDAARSNRINAYRVLLTRARRRTVIWVPRGDARDPTRDPALYDAIADYLTACGAAALSGSALYEADAVVEDAARLEEPALL